MGGFGFPMKFCTRKSTIPFENYKTPGSWDVYYGRPCPNTRSESLRTSFDGRERESQPSHALERIEGIMARMEHHFAASTPAPATSSAPHSAPFYPGEFQSFHFELLKICLYFTVFTFRGFYPCISLPALVRVRSVTWPDRSREQGTVTSGFQWSKTVWNWIPCKMGIVENLPIFCCFYV
jgi:hypothetical protein